MTNKRFKNLSRMAALIFGHLSCLKINCNPLLSSSYASSSKYLFYVVLLDLFVKFSRVFGGIWQYNVEIRKKKFRLSAVIMSL